MTIPSFEDYLGSLSDLAVVTDPTLLTADAAEIAAAGAALTALASVTVDNVALLIQAHPEYVPALGLAVGVSRESLKNTLRHHLGTSGWINLATTAPERIVEMLDREFELLRLIEKQRSGSYSFGDLLVARAGTRITAAKAGERGRRIEDEIEQVAIGLGLSCATRTRFVGRGGDTGPCDLAIPAGGADALVVVAAKGFNSTGSKLTAAVEEVEDMARIRRPTQFVMAAIDGIGWKNRQADLRRIYDLWQSGSIDGMYTLSSLDDFRLDLEAAARRLDLL